MKLMRRWQSRGPGSALGIPSVLPLFRHREVGHLDVLSSQEFCLQLGDRWALCTTVYPIKIHPPPKLAAKRSANFLQIQFRFNSD
ncbi:hypothetical protein VN97_g5875 [Penicillium thymicola]|uniref:Uncharacterized protein n=1 Tax=Penicillium thymicola TaxID=293382 RepID=A0AAI9TIK5_PENTH|nr:hypothetical protein VN97_g5875 [Penicillium thymicola]